MINQTHFKMLNLDHFEVGDSIIIKLRNHPRGSEYYGILENANNKNVRLLGKPLAWVLAGDLKLDRYCFNNYTLEDIKLYTREEVIEARRKANEILRTERLSVVIQNPPFQ